MIQMQSILEVADNSGAKKVMCIKVLGGSKKRYANIGELIKVSVKQAIPNSKVKSCEVLNPVIVRTKKGIRRIDGSQVRFGSNSVVLLNQKNQHIGTRVFGPITRELRSDKYMKILSLALEVV